MTIRLILQRRLLTDSGDEIPFQDYVSVVVQLDKDRTSHNFVVVDKLIVPVILGVDGLLGNDLTLDFSSTLYKVGSHNCQAAVCIFLQARTSRVPFLLYPQQNNKNCVSALVNGDDCESNAVDKSAISSFVDNCHYDIPTCSTNTSLIIQDIRDLSEQLGLTSLTCHYIPTSVSSIRAQF